MNPGFRQILRWMGPLRLALVGAAAALVLLRPAPGTRAVFAGWEMLPTLIAPSLMPIVFMVLLLDAIMSAVFLSSYPEQRPRYRALIAVSLGAALLLLLWWLPFFLAFRR